jgi:F-type H+-transporting ATPase subunit epsilon
MEPSGKTLQCVVVTPESAVLDEQADFVAVPLFDGELGVLPGRAPLIGRLGVGALRIRHGGRTTEAYVEGGFVQIRDNVVTLLTERAVLAADLRADVVRDELKTALEKVGRTPGEQAEIKKAQARARVKLRVATRSKSP